MGCGECPSSDKDVKKKAKESKKKKYYYSKKAERG